MANFGDIINSLAIGALQSVRRNATDTAFEAYTPSAGANPTASVGLTAVNGSAATWMRSDGAPAIDQTISPSWTGLHQFNKANIKTTYTDAVQVENTTASDGTNTVQQSPSLRFTAHVWNTTATAADNTFDVRETLVPTSSATPTAKLSWRFSNNGGAFADMMSLDNIGNLTTALTLKSVNAADGTLIGFSNALATGGGSVLFQLTGSITATNVINVRNLSGDIAIGAGSSSVSSGNSTAVAGHTHAITSSSNPGAAASILATDANGYTQVVRIGAGGAPEAALHGIGSNANSLVYLLKLTHGNAAAGAAPGILFSEDAVDSNRGKGGIAYRSDGSGFNRGDFYFLQNKTGDTSLAALTDVVFTIKNNGTLIYTNPPAFASGDKYLVIDSSGNIHKSALGPAS